jgi:predicted phage tail protein
MRLEPTDILSRYFSSERNAPGSGSPANVLFGTPRVIAQRWSQVIPAGPQVVVRERERRRGAHHTGKKTEH